MIAIGRQLLMLGVSAGLSWWVFLGFDTPEPTPSAPTPEALPVVLTPVPIETPQPAPQPAPQPEPTAEPGEPAAAPPPPASAPEPVEERTANLELPEPAPASEPAPPPPELGAPDGEGELAAEAEDPSDDSARVSVEEAMASDSLLAAASSELSGDVRPGFATVLLAAPEEQLDIARFFGEELVLVPKSAFEGAGDEARYFRLALDGSPRVESVRGISVLERYRQYRDLFDYEYARLPRPLRELRRSVLSRADVYLFGALIPAHEWAVVVQRRREALAASGRSADETRRFVLQYRSRPQGGFDLEVADIVFADGTRFRPVAPTSSHESP